MIINFQNGTQVKIVINDTPLAQTVKDIYKHLQHVQLPFRPWDNPYHCRNVTYPTLVNSLIQHARAVEVEVVLQQCLDKDQKYFNELHKIYEQSYNGDPKWLSYHEHIHLCEFYDELQFTGKTLMIDYREKSGLLEKKFDPTWLHNQTQVKTGDVYLAWAELGKTPYEYWKNNEPDNLDRLCQLAKPWLRLKPKLHVALESKYFLHRKNLAEFQSWWEHRHQAWCQYWNLKAWTIDHMYSVAVIGQVIDVDQLDHCLKQNIAVVGITVQ